MLWPGCLPLCGTGLNSRATNTNRTNFTAEKSIEEKVKDIIVEQLGVNPEQVTPQASLIKGLGADDLDIVELVMAFEEQFGVEVPDEDAEKLQTVGDVIKYIEEKRGPAADQTPTRSEINVPIVPATDRREGQGGIDIESAETVPPRARSALSQALAAEGFPPRNWA